MTLHAVAPIDPLPSEPALRSIEQRVLWLAVRMVDYVNRDLPSSDGMKIGGHQASSASLASAMTVLWMCELQRGDRVAVKPHASPVLHALEYLLGWLDERYLRSLRQFGGLQAYPSRTKDPVPVDYSTGSVGLGAAAPLFGALAQRYVRDHLQPDEGGGRFFSILGDAELDEGNIWEAILDPATRGLGEAVWIVDFNRQSLDRVVPVLRSSGLEQAFESAGWRVVELKYGRRLRRVFTEEGGRVLRRVIDQMPNQQYQQLFSAGEDEVTEALERSAGASSRRLRKLLEGHRGQVRELIRDLGGHDLDDLREALASTRGSDRPTVIFAYTIKGHGLPIAGHPLNHSLLLTGDQIDDLRARVGLTEDTEWSRIDADSAAGGLVADAAARLGSPRRVPRPALELRVEAESPSPIRATSTQEAFGRALLELSREEAVARRIVTTAPDVSVSTNLGGWINRTGIYGPDDEPSVGVGEALEWRVSREGRHIELGISEMNLFLLLSQLGLAHEFGAGPLVPIGTVYDPFVCRGLDGLIYALYIGSRFILVGTPSGISLSREGGAHQSTITPGIGIGLPGLDYYEPAFAQETDWILRDAVGGILGRAEGNSTYLRLSTKPVDQRPFEQLLADGRDALRQDVLAGGYRLAEQPPGGGPALTLVASGTMVPEALEARLQLLDEEDIRASVVVATSPDLLYRGWHEASVAGISDPARTAAVSHLERLLRRDAGVPVVSVIDGSSHALAFVGGSIGAPQICLGVDRFGQCGSLSELYDDNEVSPDAIAAAAVAAVSIRENTQKG